MKQSTIYLVAVHSMKPRNRVKTNKKGWMNNPDNVSYDESVRLTKKLKDNDIALGTVILDLGNRSVTRNRWNDNRQFDDLFMHFYKEYKKDLEPIINHFGYTVEMSFIKDLVSQTASTPVAEVVPKIETISSV